MTSRILVIALVCASLYAAVLGAGAVAQDAAGTPTATPTAAATATATASATSAPPASQSSTATPFPSPVQTVVAATPDPAPQTATPQADATGPPSATPAQASVQPSAAQADPTATSTPSFGVDQTARPKHTAANRAQGVGGKCAHDGTRKGTDKGALVGDVVTRSPSSSTSDCPAAHPTNPATAPKTGAVITPPIQHADGSPSPANPTYSLATPGAVPIGVPNFFIEKFRIPPFLLPIYQAAGIQYGIRWEVLAAINEIETDYGRNLNVSSAGALGWMQFMPQTWDSYGVDANGDGQKDPFNPVDAIFAAARYLRAAGADQDLRRSIFAYNHADWYVDSVLMRARLIGGLPADLVGSLTGLTQGRFPVAAKATYANALTKGKTAQKVAQGQNAAYVVESNAKRRSIRIFSRAGAPVLAVNDGRITRMGHNRKLGNFVELQDAYGNTYTYARLGRLAKTYPFPKERKTGKGAVTRELTLPAPKHDAAPKRAASAITRAELHAVTSGKRSRTVKVAPAKERRAASVLPVAVPPKARLFAHPARPNAKVAGGRDQLTLGDADPMILDGRRLNPRDYTPKPLKRGARVSAGTILGRIGRVGPRNAPHVLFEIRPAGRGAPRIDPKPILDGWKLLESTAIYRSKKRNPFFGADAVAPSIGQILLMSKEALQRHVLANPRIQIYDCGRHDIASGLIDRRVLATLEFLAASGLKPTVSALQCGHSYLTTSGNVSEHSTGSAVDVAAINGIPIVGHQGKGSITDLTIQRLLTLQGAMKPHQIISLMTFQGADNTFAMGDHYDHIHLGFRPVYGANSKAAKQVAAVLKPDQWIKLIDRLSAIDNPVVREQPSKFSVAVTKRASGAHAGE